MDTMPLPATLLVYLFAECLTDTLGIYEQVMWD